MNWDKKTISNHKKAANLLSIIKDETFYYLKNNPQTTEFKTQEFVLSRFKNYNLKTDTFRPIISFRQNTALVHYYASPKKSKKLQPNSLVLVDIWARLNKKGAPFADITWIAYHGDKIPDDIKKIFDIVVKSRNKTIDHIKTKLEKKIIPTGKEIDAIAENYIENYGFGKYFLHGTGHPLGFTNDHGRGVYLNEKGRGRLSRLIGYTIEPGIYLKNKFGVRSEINFFISESFKLNITTSVQNKIISLKELFNTKI
ncbi:MAG: M24 family metallopeptidase [bacterium]